MYASRVSDKRCCMKCPKMIWNITMNWSKKWNICKISKHEIFELWNHQVLGNQLVPRSDCTGLGVGTRKHEKTQKFLSKHASCTETRQDAGQWRYRCCCGPILGEVLSHFQPAWLLPHHQVYTVHTSVKYDKATDFPEVTRSEQLQKKIMPLKDTWMLSSHSNQ